MVDGSNNSTTTHNVRRGLNRRQVLAAGVTGAAITGFPYVSRGLAAQTLKFWQFYAPGGGVPSQDKWYEDLVKDWNASHEVKVELVYVPNNAYMDGTKLPTAFASGAGPDLFIISPGDFLRYYNGGVLLDLTPFMEQSARDDFLPSVIANRMVDGKIYGLPYEVEPMAMYYSVDAFNEVGLTEKDVPKTWEELLAVAKKLTNQKRYGVLFETNPGYYQNFTWYPFLWEAGGDFQTKDGQERIQHARHGVGAEVLAGRHQHGRRAAQAPGRRRVGLGSKSGLGLLRHAKCRHLGDRPVAGGRAQLQVWRVQAADASGRKISHHRRRLGVCRQRQRMESEGCGRVRRLGAGFAEGRLDRPDR